MTLSYIRKTYNVPAYRGRKVTVNGRPGVITSAYHANLRIRLEGEKRPRIYHPKDEIDYGDFEPTEFQNRVLKTIKRGPNQIANWYEVAWNGFANDWGVASRRGVLITNIQRAAAVLRDAGLIIILSPKDQYDAATYCARR